MNDFVIQHHPVFKPSNQANSWTVFRKFKIPTQFIWSIVGEPEFACHGAVYGHFITEQ